MSQGWIKLHRQLQNCFLWSDKPYAQGQAWVDLILLANHENKKIPYKGEIITCERGTVNRSISELAERWGWDRKKVRRFLSLLESDNMVTVNATTHRTTVTLINYDVFQLDGTTNVTTDGQPMTNQWSTNDQPFPTNKNVKNDKNVKNEKNEKKNIYGSFQNVKLTDEEYQKLIERFPNDYNERIENLAEYMASKHKRYASHYATILNWSRKEVKAKPKYQERNLLEELANCT